VEVGFLDTWGHALAVAVSGRYAYVADWDGGLRVIDVSTPSDPIEVGFFEDTSTVQDVAVSGNHAYLAAGSGLLVIDVSDPLSPVEIGSSDTPAHAMDVSLAGGMAYVTKWFRGVEIFTMCGDSVFADSFESGDCTKWSREVP
jgi:hypothetical protein